MEQKIIEVEQSGQHYRPENQFGNSVVKLKSVAEFKSDGVREIYCKLDKQNQINSFLKIASFYQPCSSQNTAQFKITKKEETSQRSGAHEKQIQNTKQNQFENFQEKKQQYSSQYFSYSKFKKLQEENLFDSNNSLKGQIQIGLEKNQQSQNSTKFNQQIEQGKIESSKNFENEIFSGDKYDAFKKASSQYFSKNRQFDNEEQSQFDGQVHHQQLRQKSDNFIPNTKSITNLEQKKTCSKQEQNLQDKPYTYQENIQVSQKFGKNYVFSLIKQYLNDQISYLFPWYQFNFFVQQQKQNGEEMIQNNNVSQKFIEFEGYQKNSYRWMISGVDNVAKVGVFVIVHKLVFEYFSGFTKPYLKGNSKALSEKASFLVLQQIFAEKNKYDSSNNNNK